MLVQLVGELLWTNVYFGCKLKHFHSDSPDPLL
jgi:hypothetical protein